MRSSDVNAGDTGTIGQYNKLRDDAYASSMLLAHEQSTPDLTLYVEPGAVYFGEARVDFAGGNSPSFTAPATNPRIDVLSINSSGTLVRTAGAEAGSPVAPSVPTGEIPICQVYNKTTQTQIYDSDQGAGKGYIYKDTRPFIQKDVLSDVQIFTSSGTWNKPANANIVEVMMIGGGGGGGRTGNGGQDGGAGGGGGGYIRSVFQASILGSTETVTVGTGGAGATAEFVAGGNGNASTFGAWLRAGGGTGGQGASDTGGTGGSGIGAGSAGGVTGAVGSPAVGGGAGGAGGRTTAGAGVAGGAGYLAGAAGGGSGGAGANAGGAGGASNSRGTVINGGAGGASGTNNGSAPTDVTTNEIMPGAGGGGGGGSSAGTGGVGGAGGKYGGGGGGGGGGSTNSGNGGNGANGIVVVVTYF